MKSPTPHTPHTSLNIVCFLTGALHKKQVQNFIRFKTLKNFNKLLPYIQNFTDLDRENRKRIEDDPPHIKGPRVAASIGFEGYIYLSETSTGWVLKNERGQSSDDKYISGTIHLYKLL